MKYNPTREELRALHTSYELGSSRADAARAGWECGYEARQAREKEHFASAHGMRTVTVLKALLTIIRPDDPQEIAIVDAAVTLLGDLEKGALSGAMGSSAPIAEAKGANGPGFSERARLGEDIRPRPVSKHEGDCNVWCEPDQCYEVS